MNKIPIPLIYLFSILILPIHVLSQNKFSNNSTKIKTYCNHRFDYCINYPIAFLFPQPESGSGDGRVFNNKQGDVVLTVFGRMNDDPDSVPISLEKQFNDDIRDVLHEKNYNKNKITYKKLGKTFFVISGYKNGKIFYQKTIIKDKAFAFAILEYSENEKEIFNNISSQLFKSFK